MWARRGCPKYNNKDGPVKRSDCAPQPAPLVTRMTRTGLEKLVAHLKCGQQQPWPLDFAKQKKQLLHHQVIEPCIGSRKKQKWPPPVVMLSDEDGVFWRENDENRDVKRKKSIMAPSIKRFKPLVELEPELRDEEEEVTEEGAVATKEPDALPVQEKLVDEVGLEQQQQQPEPDKDEFMLYFNLNGRRNDSASTSTSTSNWCKFNHCTNIPFSSDVGRAMAAREHHHMPEDLKMRRLERTEWYINKPLPLRMTTAPTETDYYDFATAMPTPRKREEVHSHRFKMPKRQMHHRRWSIYQVDFLARFCKPASVVLDRLDPTQLPTATPPQPDEQQQLTEDLQSSPTPPPAPVKELKVVISNAECSASNKRKMRTSPRLKSTDVKNCCC